MSPSTSPRHFYSGRERWTFLLAYIILPAAPAHGLLQPEPAFGTRSIARTVRATFDVDGDPDSPDIAFDDLARMHVSDSHAPGKRRRYETPTWAVNDRELQRLLTLFYERRAHILNPQGSLAERLRRAWACLKEKTVRKNEVMERLCRGYVNCKDRSRRRRLEVEIEGLDSTIISDRLGPGQIVRLVHCYYRLGLNSVQTGQECSIKPGTVRQFLYRLHHLDGKKPLRCPKVRPSKPKSPFCECGTRLLHHHKRCARCQREFVLARNRQKAKALYVRQPCACGRSRAFRKRLCSVCRAEREQRKNDRLLAFATKVAEPYARRRWQN